MRSGVGIAVHGSDGVNRIFSSSNEVVSVNPAPCVVYELKPIAEGHPRDSFSEFDRLVVSLGSDAETNALVAEGRRWVGSTFYGSESPTLATLRLAAGLSQREFGDACGLDQPHVSRSESGRHEPGLTMAAAMAKTLNVSLEVFYEAWKNTRRQLEAGGSK